MKKVMLAVALVACFVTMAVAADEHPTSVARPEVVAGGTVPVHPFVNVPETMASSEIVFGSDYSADAVWWWNTKGKLLGTITSGLANPQGLDTDLKSNLYVANTGASTVLVYKKPYTGTPTTLSASGWYPVGVAEYNNGEYIAVTNIFATSGAAGSVLIFKSDKLVATISSSSFYYYYFCAWDAKGNLYVDGRNEDGDTVVGWVPGAAKGKTTLDTLTTSNSIEFPGGVQVSIKGLIAIDDQEAYAVYSYKAPVKGSLGSPVDTTPLSDNDADIVSIALDSTNKNVWGANASDLEWNSFAYPKGGSPIITITQSGASLPIGVALLPKEKL